MTNDAACRQPKVLNDRNLIFVTAASVFLPYPLTGVILICLAVFLLCNPRTRGRIFVHAGSKALLPFFALALVVPLLYRNWLGLLGGLGFIFILIIGLFVRSAMTRDIFEHMVTLICLLSVPITIVAMIEMLLMQPHFEGLYRCSVVFMNPNYLATIMGTVIILCGYKVVSHQGHPFLFYGIALFDLISIYLCGSLFVWVEVFIGVAALLLLMKRHRMLSALLLVAGLFCILLYLFPDLIPRLSESRITTERREEIWLMALRMIGSAPLFGHGLLSYHFLYPNYPDSYPTLHAHSIYLDPLLNFGIVGTVLLLIYFVMYYRKIRLCIKENACPKIASVICALTLATLVHGITDITVLWIQTGLLFILLMGGLGACERNLIRKNHAADSGAAPPAA
ncbi:MAG TPA: O-antigen ligase family protein [Firmicutes bacterium]|nr:O-antigen ligase family protein [Bacillota bacterium]